VITSNNVFGIVGETLAAGDVMNGGTALVRRGAIAGDELHLQFDQLSTSAPAKWVEYGVPATFQRNAWGDVVFRIAWKPIGFQDSCWRVLANGVDTGIVLGVGR